MMALLVRLPSSYDQSSSAQKSGQTHWALEDPG